MTRQQPANLRNSDARSVAEYRQHLAELGGREIPVGVDLEGTRQQLALTLYSQDSSGESACVMPYITTGHQPAFTNSSWVFPEGTDMRTIVSPHVTRVQS